MEVEELNVLVHPLYDYLELHRIPKARRKKVDRVTKGLHGAKFLKFYWGKKILQIKGNPNSVLVIFTPRIKKDDPKDVEKLIAFAKRELVSRLIVVPPRESIWEQTQLMLTMMQEYRVNIGPNTRFVLFGEHEHRCVTSVSEHLRLFAPKYNLHIDRKRIEIKSPLSHASERANYEEYYKPRTRRKIVGKTKLRSGRKNKPRTRI